jgi:hypothetical protein
MTLPAPLDPGPRPERAAMITVDEQVVRTPLERILALALDVERWPALLLHYRYVRILERRAGGETIVEMSANRPFAGGLLQWPTWWRSRMTVTPAWNGAPCVRYTHVAGITRGMEVEWAFEPVPAGTLVRITHWWNGPPLPLVGAAIASLVIGPVFVHGIASRTLAGLAAEAERGGG